MVAIVVVVIIILENPFETHLRWLQMKKYLFMKNLARDHKHMANNMFVDNKCQFVDEHLIEKEDQCTIIFH